jgi:hypothetical protein
MSYVVVLPNNSYKPMTNTAWVRAGFVNYKKGALDSQPQVLKFTSCLPMVGGSLRALRLLPPHRDNGGRRGRDRMILGFTTAYAFSAYYH